MRFEMPPERESEELRAQQLEREQAEETRAHSTGDEQEAAQHERRAAKARYLRGKLEERGASEDAAEAEEHAEDS